MPERDWQADMELCCKVQELMRKYEGYVPVDVLERKLDFPMQALKGWPVALEERTRLEERARELETQVAALRKALQDLLAVDNIPTGEYDSSLMGVKDNAREALASSELGRAW